MAHVDAYQFAKVLYETVADYPSRLNAPARSKVRKALVADLRAALPDVLDALGVEG